MTVEDLDQPPPFEPFRVLWFGFVALVSAPDTFIEAKIQEGDDHRIALVLLQEGRKIQPVPRVVFQWKPVPDMKTMSRLNRCQPGWFLGRRESRFGRGNTKGEPT